MKTEEFPTNERVLMHYCRCKAMFKHPWQLQLHIEMLSKKPRRGGESRHEEVTRPEWLILHGRG